MTSSNTPDQGSERPSKRGEGQGSKHGARRPSADREAVLRELQSMGKEARWLHALKKARTADIEAIGQIPAERSKALRQAILAQTVGHEALQPERSIPSDGPTQTGTMRSGLVQRLPVRTWTALGAAAVLGVALVGAWFALRPQSSPNCDTLACLLDDLPLESLLELNDGAMASDYQLSDRDWSLAVEAVALEAADLTPPGGETAADGSTALDSDFAEGAIQAPAEVLHSFEQNRLELEQLDWDAFQLDDASLDALEDALLGESFGL